MPSPHIASPSAIAGTAHGLVAADGPRALDSRNLLNPGEFLSLREVCKEHE